MEGDFFGGSPSVPSYSLPGVEFCFFSQVELIGHLSCGPRNCGPQSGSRRLCSSPRTCCMLGAWVSCIGASCGNRPPLPSGVAWTKVYATPPSWTCKDAPSGLGDRAQRTLPGLCARFSQDHRHLPRGLERRGTVPFASEEMVSLPPFPEG